MNTKLNTAFGFIALATALAISTFGLAETGSPDNTVSETVTYRDLDLSTPTGVRTLYQRIALAAYDVCGPGQADLLAVAAERAWEDKAMLDAVTKVGHPDPIAMYNAGHHYAPIAVRVAGLQPR